MGKSRFSSKFPSGVTIDFFSVNYEDTSCESNSLEAVEEVHIEVMVAQTVTAGRIETAEIALQLVVRSSASSSRDCPRRGRGRT